MNKNTIRTTVTLFLAAVTLMAFMPEQIAAQENIDEINERIQFIEDRLAAGTKNARRWQYGWTTAFGVYTAFNGLSALGTVNREDEEEKHAHFDYKVKGIKSALAFGQMIVDPLTSYTAREKLDQLPDFSAEDKLNKMREAERLLKACAEREKRGRSWQTHAVALLANLFAGFVIANDDDRTSDGITTAVAGTIVSEIRIFTTPTRSIDDWKTYHSRYYFNDYSRIKTRKRQPFAITALPTGFQFTYIF